MREITLKSLQAEVVATVVLAANPPPAPPPRPTILGSAVVIIALLIAIVIGWWHWREANEDLTSDTPDELLASFEEAHAAGELDEAEMKRLRAKLAGMPPPPGPKSPRRD